MKKCKNNRKQYIICYDIENSQIYDIFYYFYNHDEYVKCPKFQHYFNDYIGNKEIYLTNDYLERSKKLIDWYNKYNGLDKSHYQIVANTHKYLGNLYMYDCTNCKIDSIFTFEPYTDNIEFNKIIELWENDCDILFTAHNLDYEYSYIRYNTNLLKELKNRCKDYKIIAVNTTNIKSIEFTSNTGSKFIIRDTYLISNKSIKNLGNEFDIPKLEYNYEQTRIFKYQLTETDYKYNQRDNEIAMQYIFQLQKQLPIYNDITKLPISATHHAKNICKNNPDVNYKIGKTDLYNLHKILSPQYNMPDLMLYQKFYNASGGGLIGVNPKFTGKWLKNVCSFDIKSAYPSQMYNKYFPKGNSIKELTNSSDKEYILNKLTKYSKMMMECPQKFYNNFLPECDYLLLVKFENLKAKRLSNDNIILSLGSGKNMQSDSDNEITNRQANNFKAHTINGKTYKSKSYTKWLYGLDLIYHLTFYEFKNITIERAYKYIMIPCDEYIISKCNYYVKFKEKYKYFTKYCRKHNFEDTYKYCLENGAEEYTLKSMTKDNYINLLDNELLRIKGIFNGLFGQEYQNIYHHKLDFTDDFEIIDTEKYELIQKLNNDYIEKVKKCNTHYTVGAYIAAWSRFELACMIWHGINAGGTIYYFHTDSLKIGNVSNNLYDNWLETQYSKYFKQNSYKLGLVDFEEKFKLFYTPETLKDIGIENVNGLINISITFSGIKHNIYFGDILKKYNKTDYYTNIIPLLKELNEKLKPQIIPPELTGKLVRNRTFAGYKTDLGQINFGVLEPTPYNFKLKE